MHNLKSNFIYSSKQIQQLEKLAWENGLSNLTLMERAGASAYQKLRKIWPQAKHIHVFCGSGNNGGDGYALAKLAKQDGLKVTIWQIGDIAEIKNPAKEMFLACTQADINIKPLTASANIQGDIIVDALLGTGLNQPITGQHQVAIEKINNSNLPVLAIDVPSGLHADTGKVLSIAVNANITITFIAQKIGLLTGDGPAHSGKIYCDNLQIPESLSQNFRPLAQKLNINQFKHFLLPRRRNAHKGHFGHVLIIGSDYGMPGAVHLAGEGAARAGAGLISIATRSEHAINAIVTRPELMCHGIEEPKQLLPLIEKANVIIIGPGLGRSDWSKELFAFTMQNHRNLPLIVDGDALFWLAQYELSNNDWVLTPHPGEAARLLHVNIENIEANRLATVGILQMQFGGTIVLKGAGSLILGNSQLPTVCTVGNPGMASGGMGDLLTGVIAGLIAQGIPTEQATQLGVLIHSSAADQAADLMGERGLLASDLLPYIRLLVNLK